ncbi:hypothetical protein NGA_0237400, partial [Nannochloropsis gaditana CCMP526]|uniref:uncharacterized protein n=1 Tax=Nannochloropsis gaditana (strain CCMP526) TaxID=1093141 RepID=UPI00029F7349
MAGKEKWSVWWRAFEGQSSRLSWRRSCCRSILSSRRLRRGKGQERKGLKMNQRVEEDRPDKDPA